MTRRKDTSPWWVGPVPQFWGKPRTFLNPSSCFCHGADPIDGHRKVVGQDQYPALGEVRETAKLLPRGESPWWRDEGRHLLILCLFSIRGMRLAHKNNAKSREHAHTCRKARAICKLRYKNKKKNQLSGSVDLDNIPKQLLFLYSDGECRFSWHIQRNIDGSIVRSTDSLYAIFLYARGFDKALQQGSTTPRERNFMPYDTEQSMQGWTNTFEIKAKNS